MKRLLFVIADLGAGGAQRVMSSLANELSSDFQIDVVSISMKGEKSFYPYNPSIDIHYAGVPASRGDIVSGIYVNVRRVAALRKFLKERKPDIVVSFLTEINCISLLACAGTGIPVIVSERSDPYYYPSERLWRVMRRLVYPLAENLVCQTAYAAGFFKTLSRKTVIYNPVSIEAAAESDAVPVSGPYVLGVGRLSPEKGFDLLIEAHALAHGAAPALKLVLIGDGPEKGRLTALAHARGTAEHVVFAGSQQNLAPYYKHATAFVLPSQFEGMPNALLEAMAHGCPVIVTPHFKAAPEIIEDGQSGILLKSLTKEEISSYILFLYENSGVARGLGSCAMENIKALSPSRIYKQWRQLLADSI